MKVSDYLCKQHSETFLSKVVKINYNFPMKLKNSICKAFSLLTAVTFSKINFAEGAARNGVQFSNVLSHGTCTTLFINTHYFTELRLGLM